MIIIHQGPELTLENSCVDYIGNWYADFPDLLSEYKKHFIPNDIGYHKVENNGDIIISISKCMSNQKLPNRYINALRMAFDESNCGEVYMYIHKGDIVFNDSNPDLGVSGDIFYFSGCSPLSVICEYSSKEEFVEICKKEVNSRFQK